ncbi:MAG: glycosyltransferase [Sphingobacteriia bacterium]
MPKVLRIINRLNIGGPTYNAAYLTAHLPQPYETRLLSGQLATGEESSQHVLEELGIEAHYLPHMQRELSPGLDVRAYRQLKQALITYHPDIVHTHAAKAGMLGRLAAMNQHVPVIIHTFHGHVFHSYFSPAKTRLFIQIERFLASLSSAIIALSPLQAYELTEVFNICKPEKIRIIPNGFDLSPFETQQPEKRQAFRSSWGIAEEALVIGLIGRMAPIKNHALFLEAFAHLKARSTQPVVAVLVGDGELRPSLEALCHSLNLKTGQAERLQPGADVLFTSWIRDVSAPIAGRDIVAMSSLNEGNPVALVEAQAAAKPCVSTDVGGVRDTLLPDVSGYVVPSGQPRPLAEALLGLVNDAPLRQQMGQQGRQFAQLRFSYQRLVQDMHALYEAELRKHRH